MIERLANIVESILPLEGNKCLQLISAIGRCRCKLRQWTQSEAIWPSWVCRFGCCSNMVEQLHRGSWNWNWCMNSLKLNKLLKTHEYVELNYFGLVQGCKFVLMRLDYCVKKTLKRTENYCARAMECQMVLTMEECLFFELKGLFDYWTALVFWGSGTMLHILKGHRDWYCQWMMTWLFWSFKGITGTRCYFK